MKRYGLDDTIAAISTPIGESGIGIVRLSGRNALEIADSIFLSKKKEHPSDFRTYTTHYGWIISNPKSQIPNPNRGMMKGNTPMTIHAWFCHLCFVICHYYENHC